MDTSQDPSAQKTDDTTDCEEAMLTMLSWTIIVLKKAGYNDAANFLFYRQLGDGQVPADGRQRFLSTYEAFREKEGFLP